MDGVMKVRDGRTAVRDGVMNQFRCYEGVMTVRDGVMTVRRGVTGLNKVNSQLPSISQSKRHILHPTVCFALHGVLHEPSLSDRPSSWSESSRSIYLHREEQPAMLSMRGSAHRHNPFGQTGF